jgi:hypothetical protein
LNGRLRICGSHGAVLLLVAGIAAAGEHKEYPVTLKVLSTEAISSKPDGTRTTTTCSSANPENLTCDSTQVSAAQHTELVSFADLSDGKLYMIACVLGVGRRFLSGGGEAMAANAGVATVSGCAVPSGTYKARWDKGRLKVLREKNGKSSETTFAVLSSTPIPPEVPRRQAGGLAPEKTLLLLSSTPTGAEIEIDGSLVGQTPSSIPILPGEHSIKISKNGYKYWKRKITTAGGEVTLAAHLEEAQK